jgi:RNA polymerase sigma factor (sigma-70 family)
MSAEPVSPSIEHLLQETSWIRRLSRSLVADASQADDLAQETWVRALEHPPRVGESLRAWIATVMRNLVRERRRSEGRRTAREERSARAEAMTSSAELVERLATQRSVVGAVMELDEPYRTAILLRYFEECTPTRIARELGVPLPTVKSRLARGLERLRERLDREHGGDGRTWCLALLPLAGRPFGAASAPVLPLSIGALVVNAKLLASLAGAAVVGAVLFVALRGSEPSARGLLAPRPADEPAESALAQPAESGISEVLASSGADERRIAADRPASPAPPAPVAPAADTFVLRGRVIDVEGRALAGLAVRHAVNVAGIAPGERAPDAPGGARARTDVQGRFELTTPDGGGTIVVDEEQYVTVLAGNPARAEGAVETVLVAAERLELSGVVIDEFGLPVEGASLRVELPEGFRGRFDEVLDFSVDLALETRAAEAGAFLFSNAPFVAGARLRVTHEGYLPTEEDLLLAPMHDHEIVLQRPRLSSRILAGVVVDPFGTPVEGASVAFGLDSTRSDERGAFSFDLGATESFNAQAQGFLSFVPESLIAVKPGFQPGTFAPTARDADGALLWPDRVTLRLGAEPLAIEGRVVDEDGNPLEGVRVWAGDPTFFSGVGDAARGEPELTHVENVLAGTPPGWSWTLTNAEGRFRVEGLLDRDYALEAMDPENLLRVVERGVAAGRNDVEIELDSGAVFEVLRGTVVDHSGLPVADVHVATMCDAFETRFQGQLVATHHGGADGVTTDAEGRFQLERVPRDLVYLRLDGAETIPLEWGRQVEGGLAQLVGQGFDALVITVSRRCHFQVELALPDEADSLSVLDERGTVLVLSEFLGNGRREAERMPIRDGRSNTLGIGDEARTIALFKGGIEVRRAPLQLVPGERIVVGL